MRRIHVPLVRSGEVTLGEREAHHARDVLRLRVGTAVELFDDTGQVGVGTISRCDRDGVVVAVEEVVEATQLGGELTVATAVPKGDRAEWMIEKLSELGVSRFVPMRTERSVVAPEGRNKLERWNRIATEAAKQSRRAGVMQIEPLTELGEAIVASKVGGGGWFLSTHEPATPVMRLLRERDAPRALTLFIGPEGGWTNDELQTMREASLTPVRLTATILRVETAAVTAAALAAVWMEEGSKT